MTPGLAAIALVGVVILAFLWSLHREVAGLRERMARVEGMFMGYINRQP